MRVAPAPRTLDPDHGSAGLRTLEVETPEHVLLPYELADLGSRFLALAFDTVLVSAVGVPLVLFGFWIAAAVGAGSVVTDMGTAILIVLLSFGYLGYLTLFEALREGQTPGKRRAGIRVVHDGGYPLTVRGAIVRNLLRLIDFQPAITCAVGGLCMTIDRRTRRLGDLAAGTLVVRDRGDGSLPEDAWTPSAPVGRPRLVDAEFAALDQYIARRETIAPAARARLTERLASVLAGRLPPATAAESAEGRLAALHADESARRAAAGSLPGRGSRQAAELVRQQRVRWDEYEALLRRVQRKGLRALPEHAVSRFAALYRAVAADLARARTYGGSGELIYTLERWVSAGHNLLYRPGGRSWASLGRWLRAGFPAQVRREWRALALAAALLYLPAVATFAAVQEEPALARELLPAQFLARAEEAPGRLAAGAGYVDVPEERMASTSAMIFSNNVRVTFLAFAGGMLAGLGTVLVLILNGVMLGAATGLYSHLGAGRLIWTFVVGHGVIELTAICISGAAGLLLGWSLIAPGRRTRGEALTAAAREAVPLLAGTTLLLGVAGLIESFVSPAPIPVAAKVTVSILSAIATGAYLLGAGRGEPSPDGGPGIRGGRGT